MAARKFNIRVEQGATFTLNMIYKYSNGTVIDLINHEASMQIRDTPGGRVYATLSVANGRITLSAVGDIVVRLSPAETLAITLDRGVYDLFLKAPGGIEAERLVYGDVQVDKAVSR